MNAISSIAIIAGLIFLLFLMFRDTNNLHHHIDHDLDDEDDKNRFEIIDIKSVFDSDSMETTYIYIIKDVDNDTEYLMTRLNGSCSTTPRIIKKIIKENNV